MQPEGRSDRCDGGWAPSEGYIETGAIRFHYLEWGSAGPPVVLWHGVTSDARTWWRVGPALAEQNYHVFALDLPGHGHSDDSPNGYNVDVTAALLDGALAALGLRQPAIVGHSWGAMNALVHATGGPRRVPGATYALIDPALRLGDDPARYTKHYLRGLGVPPDDRARAEIAAANPEWDPCDVAWRAEARYRARPASVAGFFEHNPGREVTGALGELRVPTLLMLADEAVGGIVPTHMLPHVEAVVSSSVTWLVVEGAGHSIHRDRFERFMETLSGFLHYNMPRGDLRDKPALSDSG